MTAIVEYIFLYLVNLMSLHFKNMYEKSRIKHKIKNKIKQKHKYSRIPDIIAPRNLVKHQNLIRTFIEFLIMSYSI